MTGWSDGPDKDLEDPVVNNTMSIASEELGPAFVPAPGPLVAKPKAKKRKRKAMMTKDKVVSSLPTAKHPKRSKGKAKMAPKSTQLIKLEDKPDGDAMDIDCAEAGLDSMDVDSPEGPSSSALPWTGIDLGLLSEDRPASSPVPSAIEPQSLHADHKREDPPPPSPVPSIVEPRLLRMEWERAPPRAPSPIGPGLMRKEHLPEDPPALSVVPSHVEPQSLAADPTSASDELPSCLPPSCVILSYPPPRDPHLLAVARVPKSIGDKNKGDLGSSPSGSLVQQSIAV
jgi:hypothetical protein